MWLVCTNHHHHHEIKILANGQKFHSLEMITTEIQTDSAALMTALNIE